MQLGKKTYDVLKHVCIMNVRHTFTNSYFVLHSNLDIVNKFVRSFLFTTSNVICLVYPQNGSWVLFTISQNSLYWGSLYQGLSVPFFIPFPKISILGHCCTCWEYLYTFLYFIYLISVAFTKIFSNFNPYFSLHSPKYSRILIFFFDGIRSKIFDFAVMSVSNFHF